MTVIRVLDATMPPAELETAWNDVIERTEADGELRMTSWVIAEELDLLVVQFNDMEEAQAPAQPTGAMFG